MLHLLLDAMQAKAGVGIPFFAPFSWQSSSWQVFSMDGWVSTSLAIAGAGTLLWIGAGKMHFPGLLLRADFFRRQLPIPLLLLCLYISTPLLFIHSAIQNNVHDLAIWRSDLNRSGQQVHFDRATYVPGDPHGTIQDTFTPKPLTIRGISHPGPARVSAIATFINEDTLVARSFVIHPSHRRTTYTSLGLLGIGFIWLRPLFRKSPAKLR
jgi:hypothetical protein